MDIKIENTIYTASCLTDVPIDLIDGMLVTLRERLPFVFEMDSEDNGHYTFINSRLQRSLMVIDGFDVRFHEYIEAIALGECIYKYLNDNFEVICKWFSFEDDEDELAAYRETLILKIAELREAIDKEKAVS